MDLTDLDTRKSLMVCCSGCSVPHSDCNENGMPTGYNFKHVHAGDPKAAVCFFCSNFLKI